MVQSLPDGLDIFNQKTPGRRERGVGREAAGCFHALVVVGLNGTSFFGRNGPDHGVDPEDETQKRSKRGDRQHEKKD